MFAGDITHIVLDLSRNWVTFSSPSTPSTESTNRKGGLLSQGRITAENSPNPPANRMWRHFILVLQVLEIGRVLIPRTEGKT